MKWLIKEIDGIWVPKSTTTTRHLPRGGEYKIIDGVETKYPKILDTNGVLSVIEDTAPKQLQDAWVKMDADIVADAAPVFGTANRESMLAFVDEFQMRIMVPEMFVGDSETAAITIGTYTVGDSLDTAVKIKGYYSEVLYDLLNKRKSKIITYLTTKATLGL